MEHTGCSQERGGKVKRPGKTSLLVQVRGGGTVLLEKHEVPPRSFSPYPLWKKYITIGERAANHVVLRAQDPWQMGEE